MYGDIQYELLGKDGIPSTHNGCWLLVDGGYHKWTALQGPVKHSSVPDLVRWSGMAERLRKDVECTFGILKIRWRVLKSGTINVYQPFTLIIGCT